MIFMSKVKICGVKRQDDIKYINRYLPEYVGVVFANSRRQVSPENAKALIANLDKRVKAVGVFVNEPTERVLEIAHKCKLDVVQVHGDETPEYIYALKKQFDSYRKKVDVWKAVRVRNKDSVEQIKHYNADAFVLDAFVEGSYGGAGKTFDWEVAVEAGKYGRIILAGGLNIKNVHDAIRSVEPTAVDVSTGVESDGMKDEDKIKRFICRVRNYES